MMSVTRGMRTYSDISAAHVTVSDYAVSKGGMAEECGLGNIVKEGNMA
jgi:hypothetical protein